MARTESPQDLAARPFHEILSILALRVERRTSPGFDDRPVSILDKLVIQSWPIRKTLLKTEIGDSKVSVHFPAARGPA